MIYLVTIVVYLLGLLAVGVWKSRGVETQDDIMVAGRRLGTGVLALTMLATWIGTGSLLGGAGAGYNYGLAAVWFSIGAWLGIFILWFIAPRARAFASYTVPDLLDARYHPVAQTLATLVTIIAYTTIVAYQFRGGSLILNLTVDLDAVLTGWTGIDWPWGMIVTALVVITYTGLAGMMSVVYTDVVNGVLLISGLVLATPFFLSDAGGFTQIHQSLPESHFTLFGTLSPAQILGLGLPPLVLILAEANMYQRFFSARDAATARRAVPIWIGLTIFVETLIVVLAVLGRVVYPDLSIATGEHEQILLVVLRNALPAGIAAVMLSAAVAIVVSTGTSFLLVPATNIVHDIYQKRIRPEASQVTIVRLTRIVIILLGIVAFVQIQFFTSVLSMALYAYTMYGALTPAVLATFFWKRANGPGAIASITGGMVTTFVWQFGVPRGWIPGVPDGIASLDAVIPALLVAVVLLIVVSLSTTPPPESRWRPFQNLEPGENP